MNRESIIAIIPARGGSKGIPQKNIRLLAGIPIIIHTILAAKNSMKIQHTIVTTDDTKIAEIAGIEDVIVISRPSEYATDSSPTIDAILHAIQEVKNRNIHPDIIVLLQPTSPLRTTEDIDNALSFHYIPLNLSPLVQLLAGLIVPPCVRGNAKISPKGLFLKVPQCLFVCNNP